MSLRITIDYDVCAGHGRCYSLAPELFEPDDEGNGSPIADVIDDSRADAAQLAAANCPERAITVVRLDG